MVQTTLVIVMSKSCSGCSMFKNNYLQALLTRISKDATITPVQIEFETNKYVQRSNLHNDFSRFVGFFPTLFLTPTNLWSNHASVLNGVVYGGRLDHTQNIFVPSSNVTMNDVSIYRWIVDQLTNNPLFTSSKRTSNRSSNRSSHTITIDDDGNPLHDNSIVVLPTYQNNDWTNPVLSPLTRKNN